MCFVADTGPTNSPVPLVHWPDEKPKAFSL